MEIKTSRSQFKFDILSDDNIPANSDKCAAKLERREIGGKSEYPNGCHYNIRIYIHHTGGEMYGNKVSLYNKNKLPLYCRGLVMRVPLQFPTSRSREVLRETS